MKYISKLINGKIPSNIILTKLENTIPINKVCGVKIVSNCGKQLNGKTIYNQI